MLPSERALGALFLQTWHGHGLVVPRSADRILTALMPRDRISVRVDRLEQQMARLDGLVDRVAGLELQFSQLRAEVRVEFSALRESVEETRRLIHESEEETRRYMRVLHEEVLHRIALIGEGGIAG